MPKLSLRRLPCLPAVLAQHDLCVIYLAAKENCWKRTVVSTFLLVSSLHSTRLKSRQVASLFFSKRGCSNFYAIVYTSRVSLYLLLSDLDAMQWHHSTIAEHSTIHWLAWHLTIYRSKPLLVDSYLVPDQTLADSISSVRIFVVFVSGLTENLYSFLVLFPDSLLILSCYHYKFEKYSSSIFTKNTISDSLSLAGQK